MANTATNVSTGKPRVAGSIYYAPLNTTLPTDASTDLATAFVSLGYVSEDGLENDNSFSSEHIKEWGGANVLSIDGDFNDSYKFTLIESINVDVLKAVFGASNVTGTLATGIKVSKGAHQHDSGVWVIDMILRDNALKRIVVPIGSISAMDAIEYKGDGAIGYSITVTAAADSSGNTSYEYIKRATTT